MSIVTAIQDQLKVAMKAKDTVTLDVLRMLKSEIKYREIEAKGALDDTAIQAAIRSLIKQRKESVLAYRDGGRAELADKEEREIAILETFLPPELGDDAIMSAIDDVLAAIPPEKRAFGPLMGQVMKKLQGQADGKKVTDLLNRRLGS